MDECYSIKLPLAGVEVPRQFKVWHKASTYMCFVVNEGSDVLERLRVGDTLNLRYYDTDLVFPSEYLETEIRNIKKNDQGRLKGRYLVDLEILEAKH
ncbi:MAG: hypothetical protein PVI20_17590 [Desulfobacteraceae bacterium]